MSGLFAALVAASAFFASLALFEPKPIHPRPKAGRWSPRTRPSLRVRLRARLRRA